MRTAEAVSLLFILFCRDPQFRRALHKLDPVLFSRFTNGEVWLLVIVRNVMSMHAGTGRSIWLRLGLRLVSMPPPISVRWLNTIAVGCWSIPRNTPSIRRI